MNGTIEFVLRMRNMMSSELTKVGTTSTSTFNKMSQSANQMTEKNKVLGMSFSELQKKIQATENTVKNSTVPSQISAARHELEALQKQASKHPGNSAGKSESGGIGIGSFTIGSLLGGLGVKAIGSIGDGISEGMEKAHTLHASEAGLKNTMQNNGTYTPELFEKVIKQSKDLASGIKFTSADVIGLQSQLRLVGNIGEKEMSRMTKASADMATKFGTGLTESGSAIAKAVNNPEMLRRLGMQLKINPAVQEHLQNLAKNGHEAQARLELLSIVESKVGGAAKAAFDADPLAKYNKVIGSMKMALGEMAVSAQSALAPSLISVAEGFKTVFNYGLEFVKWLQDGSTGADLFLVAITALGGGFLAYQTIMGGIALVTGIVTAAQWLWNAALTANPIGVVIVAIGALIGGLVMAYKKFDGFRAMMDGVWASLKVIGTNMIGMFTSIPDMIIKAFTQIPKAIADVFSGVGDLFSAIFSGNFSKVPGILKSLGGNLLKTNPVTGFGSQVFTEATKGVGDAYTKAHDKSLLDSKAAKAKAAKDKESTLGKGANLAAANADSSEKAGDTVSGAGPKIVNIHVGKFFDNLQFTTLNTTETAQQMEDIVMECFARVVYNGSKMV